jgi:hypothetical protein
LRGGERNYLVRRVVAKGDVEIVEVTASGSHDEDAPRFGTLRHLRVSPFLATDELYHAA